MVSLPLAEEDVMMVSIVEPIDIGQGVFSQGKGASGFAENDGVALFSKVYGDGMFSSIATKTGRMNPSTIRGDMCLVEINPNRRT